eukprot:421700-Pyramimonas_sp.AAC.1
MLPGLGRWHQSAAQSQLQQRRRGPGSGAVARGPRAPCGVDGRDVAPVRAVPERGEADPVNLEAAVHPHRATGAAHRLPCPPA